MIFICLAKFRKKPTKEMEAVTDKFMAQLQEHGCKFLGVYWTLGRYDVVTILEVPDKGAIEGAVKSALRHGSLCDRNVGGTQ